MNKAFAAIVAAVLWLLPMAVAEAACIKKGIITRVVLRDEGSANKEHLIDLRPFSTFGSYYVVRTKDTNLALAAILLNSLGTTVEILGSRTSCPTTGDQRPMGIARYIIASP